MRIRKIATTKQKLTLDFGSFWNSYLVAVPANTVIANSIAFFSAVFKFFYFRFLVKVNLCGLKFDMLMELWPDPVW